MKPSQKIILLFIFFFSFTILSAQQLQQFSVKGNCTMCKARIENAAKEAGAKSADWDIQTKILTVDIDTTSSAEKILKQIAKVGHDNELFRAEDATYEQLHGCCLYPRDETKSEEQNTSRGDEKNSRTDHDHEFHHDNHKEKNIDGVKIIKTKAATHLDPKSAGLTFNISPKELLKAACCNLSESFETNATVDVSFTNAVTGTKQLKMLGLDQKYTSLTKEQLPEIRGLASAYGLNFIPGRWIGGIQLTKGGSTVVNGYESISGQINTELLKASKENNTDMNIFLDINARTEMNITHTSAINNKWGQSILLHGNATPLKRDYNEDGIMDQPTGNQINAAYILNFNDLETSGWASEFGVNAVLDTRFSGQMNYDRKRDANEQNAYGISIETERFQAWNKTGHIFKGKPYQSLGLMNQFTYHKQNSFFGNRKYFGEQFTYYTNFIFESILGDTRHKYKTGASFLYDHYDEYYAATPFIRTESVPGFFAEYTHTGQKITLVAGARVDFHSLAGTQLTPRLNFKYDITPQTLLRLSLGRGFRTANIFAENQAYFASNRKIEIRNNNGKIYGLEPEIAWNYGLSLQQDMKLFGRKSTLLLDFFRTDFQKQVLLDLDISAHKMVFYNLDGKSFANSFQAQWDATPIRNLDLRLAYKYYDVQADFIEGRRPVPFMAKHRGFLNLSYTTVKNKGRFWAFDTTLNIVGPQKLPVMKANPAAYQLPAYSSRFITLNAQISKHLSERTRIYIGGENLTGTMQKNPIIDAANPFGQYFDGSMIYAPIMPANGYIGIDLRL